MPLPAAAEAVKLDLCTERERMDRVGYGRFNGSFANSHGAKTAAAGEEKVARRSLCGGEESGEESLKFKEGQPFLTGRR